MNKIINKENITSIVMKPTAYVKCCIGQDWFKNELEITFIPYECYPDYIQVRDWIMNNIDGREMNIEQVVSEIYNMLVNEYNPSYLRVAANIVDSNSHFDVIVTKSMK